MELRIRRMGWVKRMTVQLQKDDVSNQQVLAAIFGQTRLDKHSGMTSDEKLTIFAHFMGKAVPR